MARTNTLSNYIPPKLIDEIWANGKENSNQHVYRVAKYGTINEVTFMGSYEECLYEKREFKEDKTEIGSYSTSCYITPKYPQKFLKCLKKKYFLKYPHPIIIHGNTICGLSQFTKDRILDYSNKEHIDWWIYKDSLNKLIEAFKVYE